MQVIHQRLSWLGLLSSPPLVSSRLLPAAITFYIWNLRMINGAGNGEAVKHPCHAHASYSQLFIASSHPWTLSLNCCRKAAGREIKLAFSLSHINFGFCVVANIWVYLATNVLKSDFCIVPPITLNRTAAGFITHRYYDYLLETVQLSSL